MNDEAVDWYAIAGHWKREATEALLKLDAAHELIQKQAGEIARLKRLEKGRSRRMKAWYKSMVEVMESYPEIMP